MTTISILTHASRVYGRGHLARSETLASELRRLGFSAEATVSTSLHLDPFQSGIDGIQNLIIDFPFDLQLPLARAIRKRPLVALDWIEPFNAPKHNIVAFKSPSRDYYFEEELITGLEYLVVPPADTGIEADFTVNENELLIVLGSHPQPRNVCLAILLAHRLGRTPRVFGSVDPKSLQGLEKIAQLEGFHENLFSRLSGASIAVTNGGVALTEALAAGIRAIVLPQNQDEILFATELSRSHGAWVLQDISDWEGLGEWIEAKQEAPVAFLERDGAANLALVIAQRVI